MIFEEHAQREMWLHESEAEAQEAAREERTIDQTAELWRVGCLLEKAGRALKTCRDGAAAASALVQAEHGELDLALNALVEALDELAEREAREAADEAELVDELVGDTAFYSHLRDTREEEPNAAE